MAPAPADSQRLDKWMWCARIFRTRSAAAAFITAGSVRLMRGGQTRRVTKPAFSVRPGDEISVVIGERLLVIRITGLAGRRVAPSGANLLFEPIA